MADCWRQCLAHVLQLQPMLVPDFVGVDPDSWLVDTAEWLDGRGLRLVAMVTVAHGPNEAQFDISDLVQPIGAHIVAGLTDVGSIHAIVRTPAQPDFDPDPFGGSMQTVMGMYWIQPK